MMKSKNGLIITGIIIAVISLAIGYATATQTLKVNGTAQSLPNNSFNVYYTNAAADTATSTASSTASLDTGDTPKLAFLTVNLTNVGDTQTATYTVKNGSETGIGAEFFDSDIKICTSGSYNENDGTCTIYSSDFFEISKDTTSLTNEYLGSGNSETFTVTVKLIKANATDTMKTETFDVVIGNVSPVQE